MQTIFYDFECLKNFFLPTKKFTIIKPQISQVDFSESIYEMKRNHDGLKRTLVARSGKISGFNFNRFVKDFDLNLTDYDECKETN